MGYVTVFHLNCELWNPPTEVVTTIKNMLGNFKSAPLQKHDLFETERWWHLLQGRAIYGRKDPESYLELDFQSYQNSDGKVKCYELFVHSEIKNYDHEIEKFLDWIRPWLFINKASPQFLGYYQRETEAIPHLLYLISTERTEGAEEYRLVVSTPDVESTSRDIARAALDDYRPEDTARHNKKWWELAVEDTRRTTVS